MGYSEICFRIARGITYTESLFAGLVVIHSLKFGKLKSKVKNVLKKSVPASSVLHNIACNYKLWKIRHTERQVSLEKRFSNKIISFNTFNLHHQHPHAVCNYLLLEL